MYNYWSESVPSFLSISNFNTMLAAKMQCLINVCIIQKFLLIFLAFNLFIFFWIKENIKNRLFLHLAPIFFLIGGSFLCIYPFEERLILFALPLFIMLYTQMLYLSKIIKLQMK